MSKITLVDVANLENENTAISQMASNNASITAAIQNTLSLDGTLPNTMQSNLDMNSNQIINLPAPLLASSPLRLQDLNSFVGGGTVSSIPAGGITGQALTKSSNTDYAVSWTSIALLNSPAFTGTPTAPTASVGTNTTQLATTAFVLANQNTNASNLISGTVAQARLPVKPPFVILATGQSNFVQRPAFTWVPSTNVSSWNYNDTDGNVGSAYIAVPSSTINQPEKFASDIARAYPDRQVYLIGIAIGSQPISQWLPGAASPDMWANITANVPAALTAAGVTKVDALLWWEGENQTSEPWQYVNNFNAVMTRFQTQSWFPVNTPVVVYGVSPTSISTDPKSDITNAALQQAVRAASDTRRFVYSAGLGSSVWQDTLHASGAGHFAIGELASNVFLHGETHQPTLDPIAGTLRPSVIGRPAFRNLVLGGNFSTNPWRYGITFNSAANGTTFAEGWSWVQAGSGVVNVTQTADAPTIAQAGIYSAHCIDVNVTTADASIGTTDYYGIFHKIDGRSSSFLGFGQTGALPVTISFWVKSSVTGLYYVGVENSAQNRAQPVAFIVDAANTWEKKFVTIPGDTSGTWVTGAGAGLQLFFTIATGSQFVFTPAVWSTGDVRAGASSVNGVGTNGNHFKLALVQLEEGIEPSAFEQLPTPAVVAGLNENDPAGAVFQRTLSVQNAGSTNNSSSGSGAFVAFTPTVTIPANFMVANRVLRIIAGFQITTGSAPPNLEIQLKIGGTVVAHNASGGSSVSATNVGYTALYYVQATAAPGASVNTYTNLQGNANGIANVTTQNDTAQPVALATNGSLIISVESKWSAAGTGTTTIQLTQLIVEAMN